MPNYAMYIIANQGLEMSSGKLAAQVAHAAVRAYELTPPTVRQQWLGEGECKIVLQARDEAHMRNTIDYLRGLLNIEPVVVIDEGRTEVPPLSLTAIGLPVLDKDDEAVRFATESFKLYKDKPKPKVPVPPKRKTWKDALKGLKPSTK